MPIINNREIVFDPILAKRIQALPPHLQRVASLEMNKLAEVVGKAVTQEITLNDLFLAVSNAIVTVAESSTNH